MFLSKLLNSIKNYPNNNAFCINHLFYSYRNLGLSIQAIKNQISKIDNGSCKSVAIVCNDDFETYSTLFSIWFSGLSYVPLGLHNPVDRNLTILKDADVKIIVSTSDLDEQLYSDYIILKPEATNESLDNYSLEIENFNWGSNAYILFTSGSTGLPKGVPITFGNLNEFVQNFENSPYLISQKDRCLQMFELTFDVSISSFLIPLLNGACVYTVPNNSIKYIEVLKLLQTYKLTNIQIVPSIIRLSGKLLKKLHFPEVRFCILTGEATNQELLDAWQPVIPNAEIYNYYGPTEATIYCSFYKCTSDSLKTYNGMLAIGKPLGSMNLKIVDPNLAELPPGEKGEMLISGGQLTLGYLNNDKKNTSSFINRIESQSTSFYYKSGDLCFKDREGDIYYCGRLDNQVKVQGFRVELSEIEVVIRNEFKLDNVVLDVKNKSDIIELVLVVEKIGEIKKNEIIEFIKTRLPIYMLPTRIFEIDNFPLGSSGKTDKKIIRQIIQNGL